MDLNKLKDMGLEYVEKGKATAMDLTEKGKLRAKIVNNEAKLAKAQRQLGALVYSLAKGNEQNQPLVDRYIDSIASIEQEIAQLKASLAPAEDGGVEQAGECEPHGEGRLCPQCGAAVEENALFCNKCGAQL